MVTRLKLISLLVAALILMVAPAAIVYRVTSLKAKIEKTEAVTSAVSQTWEQANKQLEEEKKLREQVLAAVRESSDRLSAKLSTLSKSRAAVHDILEQDYKDNKAFYDQPLPPEGRKAWIQARNRATGNSPTSPSLSASSPLSASP